MDLEPAPLTDWRWLKFNSSYHQGSFAKWQQQAHQEEARGCWGAALLEKGHQTQQTESRPRNYHTLYPGASGIGGPHSTQTPQHTPSQGGCTPPCCVSASNTGTPASPKMAMHQSVQPPERGTPSRQHLFLHQTSDRSF